MCWLAMCSQSTGPYIFFSLYFPVLVPPQSPWAVLFPAFVPPKNPTFSYIPTIPLKYPIVSFIQSPNLFISHSDYYTPVSTNSVRRPGKRLSLKDPSWWVAMGTRTDGSSIIALGVAYIVPPNIIGHLILGKPFSLWQTQRHNLIKSKNI